MAESRFRLLHLVMSEQRELTIELTYLRDSGDPGSRTCHALCAGCGGGFHTKAGKRREVYSLMLWQEMDEDDEIVYHLLALDDFVAEAAIEE